MHERLNRLAFVALMALAASAACCNSFGCRGGRALLTVRPQEPRIVAYTLRSYKGSRQALILAGDALLMSSPSLVTKNGSNLERFAAQGQTPEYIVMTSVYESSLPIENLIGLAKSVEERLNDPTHPDERSNLRIDLVFVHGADIKTSEIELPHPALFDHPEAWAIGTFARAVEEYITNPLEARRILHAWKHVPSPHAITGQGAVSPTPALETRPGRDNWKVVGLDWPDALAAEAIALSYAQTFTDLGKGSFAEQARDSVEKSRFADVQEASSATYSKVFRTKVELVQLVTSNSPAAATDAQIATDWSRAVLETAVGHQLQFAEAVVFEVTPSGVSGAILGSGAVAVPSRIELIDLKVDRDPADHRDANEFHGVPNETRIEFSVARSLSEANSAH
jgi:7,8-dihydro-6-hydroxymethylpterin-pyrophosphokinase